MNMDEKIFMKIVSDEYGSICHGYINFFTYCQKIKSSAMLEGGLKNLSVRIRTNFANYVDDLKSLVAKFAEKKGLTNKTFKEQLEALINAVEEFETELALSHDVVKSDNVQVTHNVNICRYNRPLNNPIYEIAQGFRKLIKTCDHNINFINTTYNMRPDPRYGETTTKRIVKSEFADNYEYNSEFNWQNLENLEADLSAKKIDMFSPEYGKLITKKLRAFKADMISAMNKYFGTSTVFAEFNIPELVLL